MHCHSVSSDDSRATVDQYLKWIQVQRKRGYVIDGIVLTEHRKFDGDEDYSTLAREQDVLVLRGSELDTLYGHFLVYGVTEGLLRAIDFSDVTMDPFRLMALAQEHGAVAIPAHPGRPGIGLCDFMENGVQFPGVRIVETLNGGSRRGENERALDLAQKHGFVGIGGSDAHLVSSIGTCLTRFNSTIGDELELVAALLSGSYTPLRLEDTATTVTEGQVQRRTTEAGT